MEPTTLRLSEDTLETVTEEAEERDISRAKYLREIVENRHVHEEVRDEYEAKLQEYEEKLERVRSEYEEEIEDLEKERDRMERKLTATNDRQEDVEEIVEYVDEEKSYRRASILTRAKWWLTGMPDDSE